MPLDLDSVLAECVRLGGSDLHLKVGAPPTIRLAGQLVALPRHLAVTPADAHAVLEETVRSEVKREQLARVGSADLSHASVTSRFRVAAFRQRGLPSFVFRVVLPAPEPESLGLPEIVASWADTLRGLVVVTGPTGSGKSTTSAAVIELVNRRRACHIITIEDPIEFLHHDQRALVSQREVGLDAPSYPEALRAAMRQDPDVLLIGEVRDEETAMTALRGAETGHLVVCTMHTSTAADTVQRLLDLFPSGQVELARQMLAASLVGIVSQRLVPARSGGRALNTEVLTGSERVRSCIREGRHDLHQTLSESAYYGMRTFDQHLLELVREGAVERDEAMRFASSPHDFSLELSADEASRESSSRWEERMTEARERRETRALTG